MTPRAPRRRRPEVAPAGTDAAGMRLTLPADKLDPDCEYQFIRTGFLGKDDDENVLSAMERGFVPVTHEEMGMTPLRVPGRENSVDPYVRRAGTIAMKRPREMADAERAQHAAQTAEQMRGVMRDTQQFVAKGDPKYLQPLPETGVQDLGVDRGKFADA